MPKSTPVELLACSLQSQDVRNPGGAMLPLPILHELGIGEAVNAAGDGARRLFRTVS